MTIQYRNIDEVKFDFLYFDFSNTDFSFDICSIHLERYGYVQNIRLERSVSQNID